MKVLIISHVPCSTYEAMGITFCSLFRSFRREELCQLYFYPSIPDVDICEDYYQVTDMDLLKSFMIMPVTGRSVLPDLEHHSLFRSDNEKKVYNKRNNHNPSKVLLRDFLWNNSKVITDNLKRWIERENPTCIFVAPGGYSFTYNIACSISDMFRLPIVSYICDEYYFISVNGLLSQMHHNLLKKAMARFFEKSSQVIGICDSITDGYSKEFNIPAETVYTGSRFPVKQMMNEEEAPDGICYFGNIVGYKRYKSILEVGQCLAEINSEYGFNYTLSIYTGDQDSEIIQELRRIPTIRFKGFVSGEEYMKAYFKAPLLLHVEAFDTDTIDMVKNSVSTKIADALASGICLIAYGPKEVASIDHLIRNECAFVATDAGMLKKVMLDALTDNEKRIDVKAKALKTAEVFHNSYKNSQKIYTILEDVNEKDKK